MLKTPRHWHQNKGMAIQYYDSRIKATSIDLKKNNHKQCLPQNKTDVIALLLNQKNGDLMD